MMEQINILPSDFFNIIKDGDKKYILLDVREDVERKEYGIIPGSNFMSFKSINDSIIDEFLENFIDYKHFYVYCRAGVRSQIAIQQFIKHLNDNDDNRIINFYNIIGGINKWIEQGYKVEYLK